MIRCELHSHTLHSPDCRMSFDRIIATCQRQGIGCLAVTDHNDIAGAQELQRRAPFPVIIGEEIRTTEGEILGYFLSQKIPPDLSPEETIRRIRQQDGLVGVPHPFDRLRTSRLQTSALKRIINDVDVLEVFNSRNVFPADDESAQVFCRRHGKVASVGSDAHTPFELGRSNVVMDSFGSPSEFLTNLRSAQLIKRRSPMWVHAVTKFNKRFKAKR